MILLLNVGPPICSVSQLDCFTCQGGHDPSHEPHPQAMAASNLGTDEWASWVWAGTRWARPAGQGHHAWKRSLQTSRLRWILTPQHCSPERIHMCFSCESHLPRRPEGKWILCCLLERTKNPSPWHRGGLVSHVDASLPQAHSDSMSWFLPAFQQLQSQEKQHKFHEYVHATANLHFFI